MRGRSDDPGGRPPTTGTELEYAAIRRYVTGASDAAERERVLRWAAGRPDRQRYLDALERALARGEGAPGGAAGDATGAAWASLADRLDLRAALDAPVTEEQASVPAPVHVDVRRARPARVLGGAFAQPRRSGSRAGLAAAAALLLAVGGYAAHRAMRDRAAPPVASAPVETKTIETARGQRATVTLVDGSTLTLAPASRLTYAADFGTGHRVLHLEGEAHFVVAPDTARPFIVRAGDTETRDIATAFAVRAYDGDPEVRVVVTEGMVAMRAAAPAGDSAPPRPEVLLSEGDVATSRAGGDPVVRRVGDPGRYVEWTEGRLRFAETPLPQAVAELGRWYGVTIRIGDPSLRALRLTAVLDDQSAPQLSRILSVALGARVERDGDVLTLYRSETP